MKLEEITPSSLEKIDNEELRLLWLRVNQWYSNAIANKEAVENIVNAASFVIDEMRKRGFDFNEEAPVALAVQGLRKSADIWFSSLNDELVVVDNFISVVGSFVEKDVYNDVDILIRSDLINNNKLVVDYENVFLPLRKALCPNKDKKLHFIFQPQGSHGNFIPLYDLVLRKKKTPIVNIVKSKTVKLDLGCGKNKKDGFIGIDKDASSNPDILWDLENGIPFSNNSVDHIRAYHVLEHLTDKDFIMNEIYRVLKEGGIFEFEIPSTKSEGAFAHPDHKSFWNKSSFAFWTVDHLLEKRPKFNIIELDEYERNGGVYVKGILQKQIKEFKPFTNFIPPKPRMAWYTELSPNDVKVLQEWAAKRYPVAVEPKLNGFRGILEKQGLDVKLWFEGNRDVNQLNKPVYKDILEKLKKVEENFVIDCDVAIVEEGKRVDRAQMMTLNADEPVLNEDQSIAITAFDILYLSEPLIDKAFSERRKMLEEFYQKYKDVLDFFNITEIRYIDSSRKLNEGVIKWAFGADKSEGLMIKALNSAYPLNGATDEWAKMKRVAEFKVIVLDKQTTKDGDYNYECGVFDTLNWNNFIEYNGKRYVSLGKTFNTNINANIGDIITIECLEIVINEAKNSLYLLGARVIDIDQSRTEPYSDEQLIDIAKRYGILQRYTKLESILKALFIKELEDEGGETRNEIAEKHWEENWALILPKSGKGEFVYQHHWRGLSEEETKLNDEQLMMTSHSVHGDLRFTTDDDKKLWGFSVFLGETSDNRKGDKLIKLKNDDAIQGSFKLEQPKAWLYVDGRAFPPMAAGSTSNTWSKFFAIDKGEYELGVCKLHFYEIFFKGKKLKGRYIIQSIPRPDGTRVWVITKPKDQTPFAEKNKIEDEIKDQASKGYKWLYWRTPDSLPARIVELKNKEMLFKSINEKKQIVYGVVLEPAITEDGKLVGEPDFHNDVISFEDVEEAAHEYMMKSRVIGKDHKQELNAKIVESYIAPTDIVYPNGEVVKKGSWVLAVKVFDKDVWQKIINGEYNSFSIGGIGERETLT